MSQKDPEKQKQELAIHQQNIATAERRAREERARLLEATTETELEATTDDLDNLTAKDFPLANYDDHADTHELKWIQEILAELQRAQQPHPESILQGAFRQWCFDDAQRKETAMDLGEYIESESYLLGTYSRATRGEEGMQQETIAKSINESRAIMDDDAERSGGIRSKIPLL